MRRGKIYLNDISSRGDEDENGLPFIYDAGFQCYPAGT